MDIDIDVDVDVDLDVDVDVDVDINVIMYISYITVRYGKWYETIAHMIHIIIKYI